MNVKFNVKTSGLQSIDRKVADLADKSEVWLANEVLKDTDPYVPALTGSLSQRSHVEGDMVVYPHSGGNQGNRIQGNHLHGRSQQRV